MTRRRPACHRELVTLLPGLPQALSSLLVSPPRPGGGDRQGMWIQSPARLAAELPPTAGRKGTTEIPVLPSRKMSPFGFKDLEKVFLIENSLSSH